MRKFAKWLKIVRVRALGYHERLISSLGVGACGVVGVGMLDPPLWFLRRSVIHLPESTLSAPFYGGAARNHECMSLMKFDLGFETLPLGSATG